jgi:hypothetical protein
MRLKYRLGRGFLIDMVENLVFLFLVGVLIIWLAFKAHELFSFIVRD